MNVLATLGKYSLATLREIGSVSIFAIRGLISCFTPPFYFKEIWRNIVVVGFYSLPIVALTAMFAGMIIALQCYVGFTRFNAEGAIATVVLICITRELAPVFAGLMVTGRVGSSIAAEIGSMRVSDQIDALTTLGVDPMKFLVAPRIIASVLMMPFLVFIADIIGVMGGFLISTTVLEFSVGSYLAQTVQNLEMIDVISGLVKAAFFGFCMACFGCYHGFYSDLGAKGVGNATTSAVVASCIGVLALDYLLTAVFFGK
ncbi:MAG: ABC transporter permease [Alphaproteobacteria bacterium]|nr:ABC transporter permease [Alphaproteobacteria bacterium]